MAKNRVYKQSEKTLKNISVASALVSVVAGDPVVHGNIPGVALTNPDAVNTLIMQTDGVFTLPVQGATLSTTSVHGTSVQSGNILYYDATNASCKLSRKSTGVRFGYALGNIDVASAISTIQVQVGY